MTTLRVHSGRPANAAERLHLEQASALASRQLDTVRSAAERWRTGAGLTGGALSAAGIIATPDILNGVGQKVLHLGGLFLAFAIVLALTSLILSLRASIGWPSIKNVSGVGSIERIDLRELDISIWCLRISVLTAVLAILTAAASGSILLFDFTFGIAVD